MRWVLALSLAGCRIGFDPIGGSPRDAAVIIDANATSDASPGTCTAPACIAAGGTCMGNTCEIVASDSSSATCPTGMPCRLLCSGSEVCRDGASCGGATVCELRCIGFRACQSLADCGTSVCTVTCNGPEACEDGIIVGAGGSCTSHCCGIDACATGVATCSNDAICL